MVFDFSCGGWTAAERTEFLERSKTEDLKARLNWIKRANCKEYTTRGNTERCGKLFAEAEEIRAILESRGVKDHG